MYTRSHRKPDMLYSCTITLKPNLFKDPAELQYDRTYKEVYKVVSSLCTSCTIVAELTKSQNIHYHALLDVTTLHYNYRKHFVDAFRRSHHFGFVHVTQTTDDVGWKNYMKKDLTETKRSINRPPIICNDIEIFDEGNDEALQDNLIQYDMSDDC